MENGDTQITMPTADTQMESEGCTNQYADCKDIIGDWERPINMQTAETQMESGRKINQNERLQMEIGDRQIN